MLRVIILLMLLIILPQSSKAEVMTVSYADSGQTLTDMVLQSSHVVLARKIEDISVYREEVLPLIKDQDLTTYKVITVFKSHTLKADDKITVWRAPAYVPDGSGAYPIILEYQPKYAPESGQDIILLLKDREPDKMIYTYFGTEGQGAAPDIEEMLKYQRSLPMQEPL